MQLKPIFAAALALAVLAGCQNAPQPAPAASEASGAASSSSSAAPSEGAKAVSFTDDDGKEIRLDKPAERIIAFYSAHAENLYTLGAGDRLIGTHSTCTFPAESAFLPHYDYKGDPEAVIAADPDCVLIRPNISQKEPQFVQALETAGITVVSLYPESFAEFDHYIERLAMLTGTEEAAAQKLAEFHAQLAEIKEETDKVEPKARVFFEATEKELRTVTPDSMAGLALATAGGINVAPDAKPASPGSTMSSFGTERLLSIADQVDVYIAQLGAMNTGSSKESIAARPGFDTVKAVREGRIGIVDEKMVSAPNFRYVNGVRQIARVLYPDVMDSLDSYRTDKPATRRDLANIAVRAGHMQLFVPFSAKYYDTLETGEHGYGMFADVLAGDPDFDVIETAVNAGLMSWEARDGGQFFDPDAAVTPEMAKAAGFESGAQGAVTCAQLVDAAEKKAG